MDFISPKETSILKGHNLSEKIFLDSFNSNNFHHAWLLSGPKGIGKATFAFRIARYVLSKRISNNQELFTDDKKEILSLDTPVDDIIFNKIISNSHADLKVINLDTDDTSKTKQKKSISVAEIRTIKSFLSTTSAEGGWRIIIVDSMDDLTVKAENALLKSLEEPPKYTLIILISNNPSRLLPTTLSRCRKLPLKPLSNNIIIELLKTYISDINEEDTKILSILSEGSIGYALSLYENDGINIFTELINFYSTFPQFDAIKANNISEKLSKGVSFNIIIELLTWWLSRLIKLKVLNQITKNPEILSGEHLAAEKITDLIPLEDLINVWEKLNTKYRKTISLNLDKKNATLSSIIELSNTVSN
jgi:DNA polymerase-3 subunit delta'